MQPTGLDANARWTATWTGPGSTRRPWAARVAAQWPIWVALLGVAGCGADDAPPPSPADCDPLTQQGCAEGEKCSSRVDGEEPFLGTVTCMPDGTRAVGRRCGFGEPGPYGFDNCEAGSFCLDGVCAAVCALDEAGCEGAQACIAYGGVFEGRDLGLCTALCEPVAAESCAPEQGCYLSLGTGRATCHAAGALDQGEVCAYIDDCRPGLGCVLLGADGQSTVCTAFCDPGTGVTASGQSCAEALGAQAGAPACVAIHRFYSDTPQVPEQAGMCLDCADPGYAALAVCSSAARLSR